MGCKNHPDAATLEEQPIVARYLCPVGANGRRLPGCLAIIKPAAAQAPAACPMCKQQRVREDVDAVQYFCGESGCYVQVVP